jgi:diguanylate cyclase (GGDEF)-like protein
LDPRRPLRFGIVAHLAVAFIAVGALAVAANLLAEHGTVFVQSPPPPPVEKIVYVPVEVPPTPEPAPAPAPEPVDENPVDASAFVASIRKFDRETRLRIENDRPGQREHFEAAAGELTQRLRQFVDRARPILGRKHATEIESAAAALESQAAELVQIADSRRDLVARYRTQFESMEARMSASLERAWKIFGRVIARESLIELDSRIGDLRRQLPDLAISSQDPKHLEALASVETALSTTLESNSESLARSQGDDWVERMRGDRAFLSASRGEIQRADERRQLTVSEFTGSVQRLVELAEAASATAARAARKPRSRVASPSAAATRPQESTAPAETAPPSSAPAVNDVPSAQADAVANSPIRLDSGTSGRRSAILAWLSAAILLVLATVSTLVAVRIIRPVRQLLAATRKLAEGALDTRVARGGISELDALGLSFNSMAERLAEAKSITDDHQRLLEARVSERTLQLQHLAEHDPLTELPNRRQLFSQLSAALEAADPATDVLGVMVLDLDNFKNVNDTMGHAYGDWVLQCVAQRLERVVSPFGFSARQGGDEFTVVCRVTRAMPEVLEAAELILRAFQEPLTIDGRELSVSLSIGIASYPQHADDADALLRAADAALFRAKALGRHRLCVFSPDLLDAAAARFRTEQGLRQAIESGEFELAFQPEVDARTLEVPLVEALLRWRLPDGRLAGPDDFLAVAEDSGLIVEISDWVLRSAMAAAAEWNHEEGPGLRVAINVSPRQVVSSGFVDRVRGLLQENRLPARCIEFELTEDVLQTGAATIETLHALRELGIGIALDDFGAGYSSLASLEQLPLTRVKLDRSLIARIDQGGRSLAIAQTIIGLCSSLGLEITAEGIERAEQLQPLLAAPAMFLQGYLIARPVPARQLRSEIARLPGRMRALLEDSPRLIRSA